MKDLDKKINEKVQQEVDAAVREFRATIYNAVHKLRLGGNSAYTASRAEDFNEVERKLVIQAVTPGENKWPSELWERRRTRTLDDIMQTMNSLQRLLMVKEVAPECSEGEAQ
jgi:hypothetical protein